MTGKFALFLSLSALITVIGCSDNGSKKETAGNSERRMMQDETTLRLVIRWLGDDVASRQDIETRDKIRNLISDHKKRRCCNA